MAFIYIWYVILNIRHIKFGFSKEKILFNDLSLELEKGKIFALMGANGAGKTTLFNLITGFLKLQSGGIYFDDREITNKPPFFINQKGICRTFQDLRLVSKLTVKENILLAMQHHPTDNWYNALLPASVSRKRMLPFHEKANAILDTYFLHNIQDSLASEISYGQQKLLNLACCVANDAALLLLDEPVAGINPVYRDNITTILKRLKSEGKTILMIEHNTEFINEVADEILFLTGGDVTRYADLETMKNDPMVMDVFM